MKNGTAILPHYTRTWLVGGLNFMWEIIGNMVINDGMVFKPSSIVGYIQFNVYNMYSQNYNIANYLKTPTTHNSTTEKMKKTNYHTVNKTLRRPMYLSFSSFLYTSVVGCFWCCFFMFLVRNSHMWVCFSVVETNFSVLYIMFRRFFSVFPSCSHFYACISYYFSFYRYCLAGYRFFVE